MTSNDSLPQDTPVTSQFRQSFKEQVLEGLTSKEKYLPTQYLFDERGSKLFKKITRLENYYLYRCERSIFKNHGSGIANLLGDNPCLIDFSGGKSSTSRILLENIKNPVAYVPIDISKLRLEKNCQRIREKFPDLNIHPLRNYTLDPLKIPVDIPCDAPKVIFLPNSSIGNLVQSEAIERLQDIHSNASPADSIIISIDLLKDVNILKAAYDDPDGNIALFAINLLTHINRVLDFRIPESNFIYTRGWNSLESRIETFLIPLQSMNITIGDQDLYLQKGEKIRISYHHKYTIPGFLRLLDSCGFKNFTTWMDEKKYFAVIHATV